MTDIGSPTSLGLPFSSWRPRQDEMVQEVLKLDEGETLILEAGTGYGKSGVMAATSFYRPGTTALVATRDLQSQYQDLGDFIKVIWGQSHYPCENPLYISDFKSVYGDPPSREDCPYQSVKKCDYNPCEYERIKSEAMQARAKVLNYHYGFYSRWWKQHTADLFADECHRLPALLSDLVSIEVSDSFRRRMTLPPPPLALGGAPYAIRRATEWCERSTSALLPMTKSRDIDVKKRAERWRDRFKQLAVALSESDEADWYIQSRSDQGFLAKPVVPGAFSTSILTPNARSYVLMSATIGGVNGAKILADELNISSYKFLTFPHIFEESTRLVIYRKDSPRIKYKSPPQHHEKQGEMIAGLLDEYPGVKGVIHSSSWRRVKLLAEILTRKGYGDRIYVPNGDRVKSVEEFKKMPGVVGLSPSWREGLDLADDLCRLTIIADLPWQSLADPIVKLRLEKRNGKKWYSWDTCLGVVQAAGRGTRHPGDWSHTYIIDGNWPRISNMAPGWFTWQSV